MAPIKFEDHIREQLESRRIEPSAGSWEKLNQKLDKAPEKKKSYGWLYIAAAAIAAILIVSVFFTSNQNTENVSPIVETPTEESVIKEKPVKDFDKKEERVAEEDHAEKTKIEPKQKKFEPSPVIASEENAAEIKNPELEKTGLIAENSTSEKALISQKEANIEKPDLDSMLINSKIEELVAEVAKKEESGSVTNAEVNELLAEAAREISRKRNFYDSGKVDANALLADVESEIDQSFRREVFEILKDGFNKARTAIVSRNY